MAKHTPDYAPEDTFGAGYNDLDTEFVAWMTAHEESVRQAWVYDEIWADESRPLLPVVLVVKNGIVTDGFYMVQVMGKWEKMKDDYGDIHKGDALSVIREFNPAYHFVARRARNTITGEVLFYSK